MLARMADIISGKNVSDYAVSMNTKPQSEENPPMAATINSLPLSSSSTIPKLVSYNLSSHLNPVRQNIISDNELITVRDPYDFRLLVMGKMRHGVEVTAGSLGQVIANAVGLSATEKHLVARFNKSDNEIIDHYTYVILRDGWQMEGFINGKGSGLALKILCKKFGPPLFEKLPKPAVLVLSWIIWMLL